MSGGTESESTDPKWKPVTERTVSVPVSLIERNMAAARGRDWVPKWNVANEMYALLSQQTPTAEPTTNDRGMYSGSCRDCPWMFDTTDERRYADRVGEHELRGHTVDDISRPAAAPPSIADMAPGTTFVGRHVDPEECGGVDHTWFVIRPGACPLVVSDEGQHWSGDSIDPSTIRDVTPPTEGTK